MMPSNVASLCYILYTSGAGTSTLVLAWCAIAVAIWRAVSEDFAPFDIDVTTINPVGVPAANVSHVCIGGLSSDLSPTVNEGGACQADPFH
jgi:hypothetical protein